MTNDLERLIAEMARHQAQHHQCSLVMATRQIRTLVAQAREEHRVRGAPSTAIPGFVVGYSHNRA